MKTTATYIVKKLEKQYGYENMSNRDNDFVKELINDVLKIVNLKDELIKFQIYLNEKGLINDEDWDFEKQAKKYLKK